MSANKEPLLHKDFGEAEVYGERVPTHDDAAATGSHSAVSPETNKRNGADNLSEKYTILAGEQTGADPFCTVTSSSSLPEDYVSVHRKKYFERMKMEEQERQSNLGKKQEMLSLEMARRIEEEERNLQALEMASAIEKDRQMFQQLQQSQIGREPVQEPYHCDEEGVRAPMLTNYSERLIDSPSRAVLHSTAQEISAASVILRIWNLICGEHGQEENMEGGTTQVGWRTECALLWMLLAAAFPIFVLITLLIKSAS